MLRGGMKPYIFFLFFFFLERLNGLNSFCIESPSHYYFCNFVMLYSYCTRFWNLRDGDWPDHGIISNSSVETGLTRPPSRVCLMI